MIRLHAVKCRGYAKKREFFGKRVYRMFPGRDGLEAEV